MPILAPIIPTGVEVELLKEMGTIARLNYLWTAPYPQGELLWSGVRDFIDVTVIEPHNSIFARLKGLLGRMLQGVSYFLYWASVVLSIVGTVLDFIIVFTLGYIKSALQATIYWTAHLVYQTTLYALQVVSGWLSQVIQWARLGFQYLEGMIYTMENKITHTIRLLEHQLNRVTVIVEWAKSLLIRHDALINEITGDIYPKINILWREVFHDLPQGIKTWVRRYVDGTANELRRELDPQKAIAELIIQSEQIGRGIESIVEEELNRLENLELDWLLIAYLMITSPVLINQIDDIAELLMKCFQGMVSHTKVVH